MAGSVQRHAFCWGAIRQTTNTRGGFNMTNTLLQKCLKTISSQTPPPFGKKRKINLRKRCAIQLRPYAHAHTHTQAPCDTTPNQKGSSPEDHSSIVYIQEGVCPGWPCGNVLILGQPLLLPLPLLDLSETSAPKLAKGAQRSFGRQDRTALAWGTVSGDGAG